MEKTLIIIANDYPFGYGEPFLEGDLMAFSERFEKIYIVLPEPVKADKSKRIFAMPSNAELIFLDCSLTTTSKVRALARLFTSRAASHLKEIVSDYRLPLSPRILKTMLAYEARDIVFRNKLLNELIKRNISLSGIYFYTCWLTDYTFSRTLLKRKHPSMKVVSRMHGWDVYFERHDPPYLPYRKNIINHIDLVAAISDNGKGYLEEKIMGVKPGTIQTFRLGISGGKLVLKQQDDGIIRLLTLSFIRPVKQLERMIEALSRMKDIQIEWHHAGGGDDAYASTIKNLAEQQLGGIKNIRYTFHGTLNKEKLYRFLTESNIDLIVNTSASEGLPVSIMEAMAHSIPAIAPHVGGIPEIVERGFNGYLVSSNSLAEELINYIMEYAGSDLQEKNRLRKNAFQTWKEKFDLESNSRNFANAVSAL